MKNINKKVKKTTTLAKKIVKKVATKMLIKVKAKVKPKLIAKPRAETKSQSKIVPKIKTKVVAKIKAPVKVSFSGKNKTKKIVAKKPSAPVKTKKIIAKKSAVLVKTKKIAAKKPVISIKTKKSVVKKTVAPIKINRTASLRNLKKSSLNADSRKAKNKRKTKTTIEVAKQPASKVVPGKVKKVIKVAKQPVSKVVPDKTKKVIKVVKQPVGKVVSSAAKKIIKVIKKVDKINMSHTNKPKKADNFNPIVDKPYFSNIEEEYMNEQQLAHFKRILLEWKESLMESVDNTMHHMQAEVANYPDPVDRASQEEGFSLELRTRDRERKLLKKIDETLLRISEQDYGYCDDCGAEIGIRRLEARPTANQCVECKTIAEIREKQIGEIN